MGGWVDHGENVDGWGSGCDPSIGSGSCRRWDAGVAVGRDKRNAGKQHVSNNKNPFSPSLHFQRLLQHHSRRLLTRTSPELVPHTPTCHMSLFGRFPSFAARGAQYCSRSHQGPHLHSLNPSHRSLAHLALNLASFTRSPHLHLHPKSLFRFLPHPQQRTPWCTHHATTNRAASRRGSRTCTACRRS